MFRPKLVLDTNIVIDFLNEREPYYAAARRLMIGGRLGEFDLWITSSQSTDLVYVLSDGGKPSLMSETLERLRGMRTFVNVHAVDAMEVDRMLATSWGDPEDALIYECALDMRADAIITRNVGDFEGSLVRVMDCEGFFDWMRDEHGVDYAEVGI